MSLESATRSITDVTIRAFGAQLPVRSILASGAQATGVQVATDTAGNVRPGGLHYPGARALHTLTIEGTFSATVQLEGSQDNATFFPLAPTVLAGTASGAAITAPGVYTVTGSFRSLRLNVTAYTSGSIDSLVESTQR